MLIASAAALMPALREQVLVLTQRISADYVAYSQEKENAILFAREADHADLHKSDADIEMRIVPVTSADFKWLSNARFISFLRACFGIKRSNEGFLRVGKHVSAD